MSFNRRELLKASLAGLPFCALGNSLRAMTRTLESGAVAFPNRRLLTIFLRGGNDGLNTIIPHADLSYATLRPTIGFNPPGSATNPSAALAGYPSLGMHPSLGQLTPLFQQGRVAFLHRVGNFTAQRSHFTEQHIIETGRPDYSASHQGWVPQILPDLQSPAILPSVSISNRLQRMFLSGDPGKAPTHLQQPYGPGATRVLNVPFADPIVHPQSTRVAGIVKRGVEIGVGGAYPVVGQGDYLRDTTELAIANLGELRANLGSFVHDPARYPAIGDPLPTHALWSLPAYSNFFLRLEESVQLLKGGFSNIVGLELGGWDTHGNQLADHVHLLSALGHAIRSAFDDLSATPGDECLILVVSEFGRTIADNGGGTDHGVAGVCFAVGTTVNGGVYNASHTTWPQAVGTPRGVADWRMLNTPPSIPLFTNALEPATDFRVPFIEIATKFFGLTSTQVAGLGSVGPDWGTILASQTVRKFRLLGYLA